MGVATQRQRRRAALPAGALRRLDSPRRTISVSLWELADLTSQRIDRDKGVIYGVKILGLESYVLGDDGRKLRRRYTPEACRAAVPLYEGMAVYCDHPRDADGNLNLRASPSRAPDDAIGYLQGVVFEGDGLRGNLVYLKSHPMAERLVEAAERMPQVYSLSHNAQGDKYYEGEVEIITRIYDVRSVDVVTRGATTQSLFESMERAMAKAQKRGKRLAEMEGDYGGGDGAGEGGDEKQHLMNAISVLLDSGQETDLKKIDKIMRILKEPAGGSSEKTEESEEGEEKGTESHGKPGEDDGGPKKEKGKGIDESEEDEKEAKKNDKVESLEREVSKLKKDKRARELCDEAGISLAGNDGKTFLESLMWAPDDAGMKRLVEREKKTAGSQPRRGPRSQGPLVEGQEGAAKDSKSFLAAITSV